MTLDQVIPALEAADTDAEVLDALRPHWGESGLSSAYFNRLLQLYGADPAATLKLARHWPHILRYGDEPALAYRAKGAADRLAGRWLASARAFQRAGKLATRASDRYSYAAGAIDGLAKAGRVDEAVRLGKSLSEGLRALGEPGLAGRVMLNAGNALLWAERGREARKWFAAAIPLLSDAGFEMEEGAALLGLSTSHLIGGDARIARSEAERASAIAERLELDYLGALCQLNLAQAELNLARPDETLMRLARLKPGFEGSPTDLARINTFLGDAYLRVNMNREAADAYGEAMSLAQALPVVTRADLQYGLGVALLESNRAAAEVHLLQAERLYRKAGNLAWFAASRAARATALVDLSPVRAESLAKSALAVKHEAAIHRLNALLAAASARARQGKSPEEGLAKVQRLISKYGFEQQRWRVSEIRARVSTRPLRHYRAMLAAILRARLAQSSLTTRTAFLVDKSEAIRRYLAYLLGKQTPARVREALSVIEQTRAVTLLDEILASPALGLSEAELAQLESLREELRLESVDPLPSPDTRRAIPAPVGIGVKRRWLESGHALAMLDARIHANREHDCVVLAEAGGSIFALVAGRAVKLPITAAKLDHALRWLQFELFSPMVARNSEGKEALTQIANLAEQLVTPWLGLAEQPIRISAEGALYRVPWDALLAQKGIDQPAILCLHPAMTPCATTPTIPHRVAVWVNDASDLTHVGAELDAVRASFLSAVVLRTRREVLESLTETWDLVHFVGHARHCEENPMFSSIEFADGPLYATEIARSGLKVETVTLAACETGTLSLTLRDEPDGLTRAFLARGARHVCSSLWPLGDESGALFFSTLFADLVDGAEFSQAVSLSRKAVMDRYKHPYFWASIALFGGYSA